MNKKTQMCRRFQAGNCAFNSICNFAHSFEELRKTPDSWQGYFSLEKEEAVEKSEPRDQDSIMVLGATDEPHGPFPVKDCNFLEEKLEVRGSDAICLVPSRIAAVGGGTTNWKMPALDPSSWKTKLCYKWQQDGFCPYSTKCHYAHGESELRPYRPRSDTSEVKHPPVAQEAKQGAARSTFASIRAVSAPAGISRLSNATTVGVKPRNHNWPNKVSKIYGDWIDDLE